MLQGKGGRVALITTKGPLNLMEIGRQLHPYCQDFHRTRSAPPVARCSFQR